MKSSLLAALAAIPQAELRTALTQLAETFGESDQLVTSVNEIRTLATTSDTSLKTMRAEVDALKADLQKRDDQIKGIEQKQRVQAIGEGAVTKEEGLRVLGAVVRSQMVRAHAELETADVKAIIQREATMIETYATKRGLIGQRATLEAGATPGSVLVPTVTEAILFDAIEQVSQFVYESTFMTGLTTNVLIPARTGRPRLQAGPAMDSEATRQSTQLDSITFSPKKAGFLFPVDNRLLLMSAVNLGAEVFKIMMEAAIDGLSFWALWGDGSATYNNITGIMRDTTASRIYTLPAGKVSAADVADTDLQQLKAGLFLRAQNKGSWIMGSWVYSLIQNLNRLGKQPFITTTSGGDELILGNRRIIDSNMTVQTALADMNWVPADGANQGFMGFGDWKGLFIGLAGGIGLAADTSFLFGQDQTAFRLMLYLDIQKFPGRNFKVMRTAAA